MISSPSKILITGANGLLGQKIVKLCQKFGLNFLATSAGVNRNPDLDPKNYQQLDITKTAAVLALCNRYQPECIINTAAMTNVDLCESLVEECYQINTSALKNLLDWSSMNNTHLIQISTDFVFDGNKNNYIENDEANPLSVYGDSKSKAEKLLLQSNYKNWSILRTSLVYGSAHLLKRSNIVLWAREELLKNRKVTIVDDQFRAPTWAEDLAFASLVSFEKKAFGIYHTVGPECLSMFDFVQRMAAFYKQPTELVQRIKTTDLQQTADRPPRTNLVILKAKRELDYNPHSLEQTLAILEKEIPTHQQ